jgi:hypothetical protein
VESKDSMLRQSYVNVIQVWWRTESSGILTRYNNLCSYDTERNAHPR